MTWKCKNPECGRTFEICARLTIEKNPVGFAPDTKRLMVEKPCCPFCESIEFEEVKHDSKSSS